MTELPEGSTSAPRRGRDRCRVRGAVGAACAVALGLAVAACGGEPANAQHVAGHTGGAGDPSTTTPPTSASSPGSGAGKRVREHDEHRRCGPACVAATAVGDSGLTRPDYYNWPAHLRSELELYHPQAGVVLLGGDDAQSMTDAGSNLAVAQYGTPLWYSYYAQRVGALMSEATTAGARVLWVGLPIMGTPGFSAEMARLNSIYQAQAATHPGVTYFPFWNLFAGQSGQYVSQMPGPGGQELLLRDSDGVHLASAGYDRMAEAIVAPMESAWGVNLGLSVSVPPA